MAAAATSTPTSPVYINIGNSNSTGHHDHFGCCDKRRSVPLIRESDDKCALYLMVEKDVLIRCKVKYSAESGVLQICPPRNAESDPRLGYKLVKDKTLKDSWKRIFVLRRFGKESSHNLLQKFAERQNKHYRVEVSQIREVRKSAKKSSTVLQSFTTTASAPMCPIRTMIYTILHGCEFQLSTVQVWALNEPGERVMNVVNTWIEYYRTQPYILELRAFARRHFEKMLLDGERPVISASECKQLGASIGHKSCFQGHASEEFSEEFYKFSKKNGEMDFEGFFKLFRNWMNQGSKEILEHCFPKEFRETDFDEVRLKINDTVFVVDKKQPVAEDPNVCVLDQVLVSKEDLVHYLFSDANSVWRDSCSRVYQSMREPLWKYWISSSHNTYLSGHQLVGASTTEAYIRCLNLGSRCVELDCWDGRKGKPIVKHGWTLTTKVSLVKVLEAIKTYGFVYSDYPVILSIENHCCIDQQKLMADNFVETFGDQLKLAEDSELVSSPEELKGKILIKCKLVHDPKEHEEDSDFLFEKRKVCLFNQETETWDEHIMGISKTDLRFTKLPTIKRMGEGAIWETCKDLHEMELWYHGKIAPPLAHDRVKEFGKQGCFLVRRSFSDDNFVLVFLSEGAAWDFKIQRELGEFYIQKSTRFDSLFSLVTHYKHNAIEAKKCKIAHLGEGVPIKRDEDYSKQPWYHPTATATQAEMVLKSFSFEGYFLVRPSSQNTGPTKYVVSFQYKQLLRLEASGSGEQNSQYAVTVKHARILFDGHHYVVAEKKFETMAELVMFFQQNPIYKGMKLKKAVTRSMFAQCMQTISEMPEIQKSALASMYVYYTNEWSLEVKAIADYDKPDDLDALSFKKGDIISNVNPDEDADTGWCRGDCRGMVQKRFPTSHVEELTEIEHRARDQTESRISPIKLGGPRIRRLKSSDDTPATKEVTYIVTIKTSNIKIGVRDRREAASLKRAIKRVLHLTSKPQQLMGILRKRLHFEASGLISHNQVTTGLEKLVYLPGGSAHALSDTTGGSGGKPKKVNQRRVVSIKSSVLSKSLKEHSDVFLWRTYPDSLDSSNYDPTLKWNLGAQLVALNFQTQDKWMSLNQAKFKDNGGCGYVLKPDYMQVFGGLRDYDSCGDQSIFVEISVIAGRNLMRDNASVTNPYVAVEISGIRPDMAKKLTSLGEDNNGLYTFWGSKFTFYIISPELAQIRFTVYDRDPFSDSHFIGQATFPIGCMKTGLRSIRLQSNFGESLSSPSVLLLELNKKRMEIVEPGQTLRRLGWVNI